MHINLDFLIRLSRGVTLALETLALSAYGRIPGGGSSANALVSSRLVRNRAVNGIRIHHQESDK
jgi:hypothetical protein